AGTAVPQGAVCELPNPVKFSSLSRHLTPRNSPALLAARNTECIQLSARFERPVRNLFSFIKLRARLARSLCLECRVDATDEIVFRQICFASLVWIRGVSGTFGACL